MKRVNRTVFASQLLSCLLFICCLNTQISNTRVSSAGLDDQTHRSNIPGNLPRSTFEDRMPVLAPCNPLTAGQGCMPSSRGEDPFDMVVHPAGTWAYVVNRSTDNLFIIDLATREITDVIDLFGSTAHPLGPAPTRLAITPNGSCLLVTSFHDGRLIGIDTITKSVIKSVAVGNGPSDVAISPDGALAYVTNKFDWTISVIDVDSLTTTRTIDVPGGGGPLAVAFAPDGDYAYILMEDAPLYVLDTTTYLVTGNIPMSGTGWNGDLVISADGETGYAAAMSGNQVYVLNLDAGSVMDTYPVEYPQSLALSQDGSRLYVGTFGFAGESDYHLWMFDTLSGELVTGTNFTHPGEPRLVGSDIQGLALQPDGSVLYVPSIDGESIFIVDPATLEQIDLILTNPIPGFSPFRGTISPDGTRLYVASWTRKPTTVSVIDTSTREVIADIVAGQGIPCGSESWGLDIAPGGDTLYVLSSNDHCVLIADAQSHEFVDSFNVPVQPGSWLTSIAVHPDGGKAYVLEHTGVVSVFDLQTQGLTTALPIPDQCTLIKLSPDGLRGYVICNSSFSILDLASDTVVDTIQIGSGGSHFESLFYTAVNPDSSTYIIGAFFNLYEYDVASNSLLKEFDLDGYDPTWLTLGQDFVFSPDGGLGYLAMPDENAVTVFNTGTWEVVSRIDTGHAPHYGTEPVWLLMAPDGDQLFVLNELSDNILVIDTTLNQVVEVINLAKCRLYMPLIIRE